MNDHRVIVDVEGRKVTYLGEGLDVGDEVEAWFGNYPERRVRGRVVALYPQGPNSHVGMDRCECGHAILRLPGGGVAEAYFGPAKAARAVTP